MRPRSLVLAGLVALLALPGASRGGNYVPPPGDGLPVWSPDGSRVAFLTSRQGAALSAVSRDGSAETTMLGALPSIGPYADATRVALSPDWQWAAVARFLDNAFVLVAVRLDGSEERPLALTAYGTRPAWSPDSQRVAFRMFDGTLAAQGIDGSGFARLAAGGAMLAWSPDGTRIAFMSSGIHVVDADGKNDRVVADGPGFELEPKWSPDGTRIAFLGQPGEGTPFGLVVASVDGSGLRRFPGPGVSNADAFAWTPDGAAIVYARNATEGLFRLDLATGGSRRLTAFGGTPAVSSDGRWIAFAAGGECRDRYGIHVARVDGARVRRLTNDCRIRGSAGADVLRGTALADVLLGLGGDDRLYALDPEYTGDTLVGGPGDDVLVGGYREDLLQGGPGSDRLRGGPSGDALYGGSGRDRVEGQRGRDRIHVRDGWKDTVSCGTNVGGTSERDEVWADSLDSVADDCEVVHRSRR